MTIRLLMLVGLLNAAPAHRYPLRFPVLSDSGRRVIAEQFRARNRELQITRLSIDAFGFVELLVVADAQIRNGQMMGGAGFSPDETHFWMDLLRKNADLFGVEQPEALRMIPAPGQCNFNQMFNEVLLATIQINKPMHRGQPWEVRGHFWPGASPATPRIDGKSVRQKLVGGRVRHVEGGRMYPCDPVDPKNRKEACPPGPPPRTVEWTVEDKHVTVRLRTVLLRPWKQPAEIRTVWHAWVNVTGYAQAHMISGKPKLVIDAVTGEDLTARAANAF